MSNISRPQIVSFGAFVLTVVLLSGCFSQEPAPVVSEAPQPLPANYIRLSLTPPPEAQPEVKPVVGQPRTEIWRPGYWSFDNGRFAWVPGEMMAKPDFTASWSPDRWEKRQYGWVFIHGYWM